MHYCPKDTNCSIANGVNWHCLKVTPAATESFTSRHFHCHCRTPRKQLKTRWKKWIDDVLVSSAIVLDSRTLLLHEAHFCTTKCISTVKMLWKKQYTVGRSVQKPGVLFSFPKYWQWVKCETPSSALFKPHLFEPASHFFVIPNLCQY